LPTGKCVAEEVVQVATPPDTVLGLQPVFVLQVTVPVTTLLRTFRFVVRPLTAPFSPVTVAVKVTEVA
jgi:hypothetical protein